MFLSDPCGFIGGKTGCCGIGPAVRSVVSWTDGKRWTTNNLDGVEWRQL